MANFSVITYTTEGYDYATVVAALETKIETVVNTKTIRAYQIAFNTLSKKWVGLLVYDA